MGQRAAFMCLTENIHSIDSLQLVPIQSAFYQVLCPKTFFIQERDKTEYKYEKLCKTCSKQLLTKLDDVDDKISLL